MQTPKTERKKRKEAREDFNIYPTEQPPYVFRDGRAGKYWIALGTGEDFDGPYDSPDDAAPALARAKIQRAIAKAAAAGWTVELRDYCEGPDAPGLLGQAAGVCMPDRKTIRIRTRGMTPEQILAAIEHELEHAAGAEHATDRPTSAYAAAGRVPARRPATPYKESSRSTRSPRAIPNPRLMSSGGTGRNAGQPTNGMSGA